jgi:AGCS family alanine or glycine:cation symporter
MISWSYYGEQCWVWLFGLRSIHLYKLVFLVFAFLGAMFEPGSVLDFGDYMILGMAFPNILGVVLLSGKVKAALDDYLARLASGEIAPTGK